MTKPIHVGASPAFANVSRDARDWLIKSLDVWSTHGVDRVNGGFHDRLTQQGAVADLPKRCRVQARQIYSFIEAGRLGWTGAWKPLVESGMDFMVGRYRLPNGAFRFRVHLNGEPFDEIVDNYDQAFAMFALAHSYDVFRDESVQDIALGVLHFLNSDRRHPLGGYYEGADRAAPLLANPHMHFLEAALAWIDFGGSAEWRRLADDIVTLCRASFIDRRSGALREYFAADWRVEPGARGLLVEPGHQFEWAWLLHRYEIATGNSTADLVERLYDFANEHGLSNNKEIIIAEVDVDGSIVNKATRIWPQTERMKAVMRFAAYQETKRLPFEEAAVQSWFGLKRFFDVPIEGLWYDRLHADGTVVPEDAPASSLYHIIGGISELLRYGRSVEVSRLLADGRSM